MRLFANIDTKSRRMIMATLAYLLIGCGGGGGQDPILGNGSPAPSSSYLDTSLGSISTYSVFGGGAAVTNSGLLTVMDGDLGTTGVCTGITGFHDATTSYTETIGTLVGWVKGTIYCTASVRELKAAADALAAYNLLSSMTPSLPLGPGSGQLAGMTVYPGIYSAPSGSFIVSTGDLTLDAQGDPNAVWVFQLPSSLTIGLIGLPSSVLLINNAQAKNVYWQVGSAARIENGSNMVGTIIAKAGLTISTAGYLFLTHLKGRAIALNAGVTMINTSIVAP